MDSQTKMPIQGVKFEITDGEGKVSTLYTDENGKIVLANLKQGEIIIKEIEAVGKYRVNNEDLKEYIEYDQIKEIQIENELKKGSIKVVADKIAIAKESLSKFEKINDTTYHLPIQSGTLEMNDNKIIILAN